MVRIDSKMLIPVLALLLAIPISANSAQTRWSGVSFAGTMAADEDCPLEVERERLTFSLGEFPQNHYFAAEEYLSYPGSVTAEYEFYNPADYDVTATLVFPFGMLPDYAYSIYNDGGLEFADDTARYGITVDGDPVKMTLRHTLSAPYAEFNLEYDLPRLIDGFAEDEFFTPDMPVHRLTYTVSGIPEEYRSATASFFWSGDRTETRVILEGQNGGSTLRGGVRSYLHVRNGDVIVLWLIGEYVPVTEWDLFENGSLETEIPGKVEMNDNTAISNESMTLREFVTKDWKAESGILETDWYNASITRMNRFVTSSGLIIDFYSGRSLYQSLLRWYEYELTVPAGGRVVNAVSAPIYPSINGDYEPPMYKYTYLLSPAQTWKRFGTLEVAVDTPHYLIESSAGEFSKTDGGYQAKFDGLPAGELVFSLSAEESPSQIIRGRQYLVYLIPMGAVLAGCILFVYAAKQGK
ncbi:MAG: hypothetical protein E7632_10890 [Ruminococcaceae bacterium]|nr:hypothetical protein [Oscillospiraceae bacterium]